MFSNGMTPSVAKAYHEIKLTASIDVDMQVIKLLADDISKKLGEITTVSELSEVSTSVLRRGKVIGIQPTSRSRRISHITTGAKRIQAGRPSNSEMPSNIRRAKKRCLGKNIKNITANAKSH